MVRRVNFTFNASNNNNVVRPRVWKWSRQTGLQQLMGTVFTNTIPNGADFTYRRDGLLTAVDSSKSGSVAREWIAIWLGSVAAIAKARYRLAIAVE